MAAASDIEARAQLDRVLLRLATTEEANLSNVLQALLPRLLAMLKADMDAEVRTKLMEVLTHINKRVRERADIALPFLPLLELLANSASNSLGANFIMVYLKMAFPRLQPSQVDEAVPSLLVLSKYPEHVRDSLLQFILKGLKHVFVSPDVAQRQAKFAAWLASTADMDVVCQAFVDTLLYVKLAAPKASGTPAASSPAGTPGASAAPQQAVLPPGLSVRAMARVIGSEGAAATSPASMSSAASALTSDEVNARKRAILRFASSGIIPDTRVLQIALAGLSDGYSDISLIAEDLLKRVSNVDVEDELVVKGLFSFLIGSGSPQPQQQQQAGGAAAVNEEARTPAPLPVRLKILGLCTRSKRAATSFPMTLRVIFECWFGASTSLKLQHSAVRFAHMAFQLTAPSTLTPLGPVFLQGLLKLLVIATPTAEEAEPHPAAAASSPAAATAAAGSSSFASIGAFLSTGMPGATGSTSNAAGSGLASVLGTRESNEKDRLREVVYSAIGALATRVPAAFASSLAVPKLLFQRLSTEDPTMRLSVAEALSMLAGVYSFRRGGAAAVSQGIVYPQVSTTVLEDLHDLLSHYGEHKESRVRIAVLDWANRVFPFSDVRARYICCKLVGDVRVEVREAARNGLRPYARRGHLSEKFRGAHGDGDRGDVSGIKRRADPTKAAAAASTGAGAAGSASASAEDVDAAENEEDNDEFDLVADDSTFHRLASIYPLFSSLLRYCTALDDTEGATSTPTSTPVASPAIGGSSSAAGAQEGADGGGDGSEASKRARGPDEAMETSVSTAATSVASSAKLLSYVDQPDPSKVALGRRITRLSALSLAALLEFTNTCLDASAVLASMSTSDYIAQLDAGAEISLLHAYRSMIEHGLTVDPAAIEAVKAHETAASCLMQLLQAAPARLSSVYGARLGWVLRWTRDSNATVRRAMAFVLGTAAGSLPLDHEDAAATSASSGSLTVTLAQLITDLIARAGSSDSRLIDHKHGSLIALGHALGKGIPRAQARAFRGTAPGGHAAGHDPVFDAALVSSAAEVIIRNLASRYDIVREAATAALTTVARQAPLPLPAGDVGPLTAAIDGYRKGQYEVLHSLPPAFAAIDPAAAQPSSSGQSLAGRLTRAAVIFQLFRLATGQAQVAARLACGARLHHRGAGAPGGGGGHDDGSGDSGSSAGSISTEAAAICLGAIISGELKAGAAASAFMHSMTQQQQSGAAAGDDDWYGDDGDATMQQSTPAEAAQSAAPQSTSTATSFVPPLASIAISVLTTLSVNKYEQVQFTIGQALVEACSGKPAALGLERSSILDDISTSASSSAGALQSSGGVFGGFTAAAVADGSSGASATAAAQAFAASVTAAERSARDNIAGQLFDFIILHPLQSTKAVERTAAAVWLLSLVHALGGSRSVSQTSGSVNAVIQSRLQHLQVAFMRSLGEKSQFTQECAAKGLALVYESCADERSRKGLMNNLLDTLSTGRKVGAGITALPTARPASSAPAAGDASAAGGSGEETAAGAAASTTGAGTPTTGAAAADAPVTAGPTTMGLSASGDQSYKELCAMASEVGQPDLIYRFLALSSHHALWHTRGGAGFGLEALLRGKARKEISPHMKSLIPRLFRYQYDPSPRVRESMSRLWSALVRDPRKAVTEHIHPILDELIKASESANYREREAACAGLIDAINGRSYPEVGPHLEALWKSCLRAIDDIKDSVRETALDTMRSLGRLSLRLCDPQLTNKNDARAAVAVLLPFLLNDGVTSSVKDAQQQSIKYLVELSKTAGPLLRPHIPELVNTMLSAMSSFEHEGFSHLQMHADAGTGMYGEGISSERLEGARISGTRSGPFADVLERCLQQLREMNGYELLGEAVPEFVVEGPAAQFLRGKGAADSGSIAAGGAGSAGAAGSDDAEMDVGEAPIHNHIASATTSATSGSTAATGGILAPLVDKLRTLIRSGIGLPTRGATARFVINLNSAVGESMRPFAAPLLKTLELALEDQSPTLRKEYATCAAHVALYSKPATFKRLLQRLGELARSGDAAMRVTAGHGHLQLLRHCGDRLRDYMNEVMPLAFLSSLDHEDGPREVWGEVWDQLAPSGGGQAIRLYTAEIVNSIAGALDNSAWAIRRQAGAAIVRMVFYLVRSSSSSAAAGVVSSSAGGLAGIATPIGVESGHVLPSPLIPDGAFVAAPSVTMAATAASSASSAPSAAALQHLLHMEPPQAPELLPHAPVLISKLGQAIPGRVYEGKEVLVTALGFLVTHVRGAFGADPAAATYSVAAATHGSASASSSSPAAASSTVADEPLAPLLPGCQVLTRLPIRHQHHHTNSASESSGSSGSIAATTETVNSSRGAVPIEPVLRMLAQQCARSNATDVYLTASCRALASACNAFPPVDCYGLVLSAVAPILRRGGRLTAELQKRLDATLLSATSTAAAAAATATAGAEDADDAGTSMAVDAPMPSVNVEGGTPSFPAAAAAATGEQQQPAQPPKQKEKALIGGKHSEEKEGEARTAAKHKAEEEGLMLSSACSALAAAFPASAAHLLQTQSSDAEAPASSASSTSGVSVRPQQAQVVHARPLLDAVFEAERAGAGLAARLQLIRAAAVVICKCGVAALGSTSSSPAAAAGASDGDGDAVMAPSESPTLPVHSRASHAIAAFSSIIGREDRYASIRTAALQGIAVTLQRVLATGCASRPPSSSAPSASAASGTAGVLLDPTILSSAVQVSQKQIQTAGNDPRSIEAARMVLGYLKQLGSS